MKYKFRFVFKNSSTMKINSSEYNNQRHHFRFQKIRTLYFWCECESIATVTLSLYSILNKLIQNMVVFLIIASSRYYEVSIKIKIKNIHDQKNVFTHTFHLPQCKK